MMSLGPVWGADTLAPPHRAAFCYDKSPQETLEKLTIQTQALAFQHLYTAINDSKQRTML